MHALFIPDNCAQKVWTLRSLSGIYLLAPRRKLGGSPVRVVIPILPDPGFAFNEHGALCSAIRGDQMKELRNKDQTECRERMGSDRAGGSGL